MAITRGRCGRDPGRVAPRDSLKIDAVAHQDGIEAPEQFVRGIFEVVDPDRAWIMDFLEQDGRFRERATARVWRRRIAGSAWGAEDGEEAPDQEVSVYPFVASRVSSSDGSNGVGRKGATSLRRLRLIG